MDEPRRAVRQVAREVINPHSALHNGANEDSAVDSIANDVGAAASR